jgi:hypothetical protein
VADAGVDRHPCCRVLELRQYALQPGGREPLVTLFDHYFIEALEATGMHVPGLFENLDDADRLVWWRGFTDMETRRRALSDFYVDGAVWREHGLAANATMVDSDDVLLLEPVYAGASFPAPDAPRLGAADPRPPGQLLVEVLPLSRLAEAGLSSDDLVERLLGSAHRDGADVVLVAVTHPEPNDFPALPVRDEQVAVWLLRHPDPTAGQRFTSGLGMGPVHEQHRLRPLTGSQIR